MSGIDGLASLITIPVRGAEGRIPLTVGESISARIVNLLPDGTALLGIRGALITASADMPLTKDMVAFFKVAGVSVDGKLTLQFQRYADAPAGQVPAPGVPLEPGSLLRGTVGPVIDGMRTIVFPEGKLPVRPEVQLQEGGEVVFRVAEGADGPELELLPPTVTKFLFPQGKGVQAPLTPLPRFDELVRQLRDLSARIVEKGGDPQILEKIIEHFPEVEKLTPLVLKQAIERGGLLHEAKLRRAVQTGEPLPVDDLKTRLAEALKLLEGDDGNEASETRKGLETLLRRVEDNQIFSVADGALRTFLPLLWPGLENADIDFRKRTGDHEAASCRLDLDLSDFGSLSVMIMFSGGAFSIFLRPEKSRFSRLLVEHLPELRELFSRNALPLRTLEVVDGESRAIEQVEASMAARNVAVVV